MAAQANPPGILPQVAAGRRLSEVPRRVASPRTLVIYLPDGNTETVRLEGARVTVGRSHSATLSFPDVTELSRLHCALEGAGPDWHIRDLGSRNGTFVNNRLLASPHNLQPGDRITAGNLSLVFDPVACPGGQARISLSHPDDPEFCPVDQVVFSLDRVDGEQTLVLQSGPLEALLRAGHELSKHQPLFELIPSVLDLALLAVSARRGALLLLEGGRLVTKAHRGEYFAVSTTVRDRVISSEASVLIRDTRQDELLKDRRSILDYDVDTVMAVPLRAGGTTIGLLYVDSPVAAREFTEEDLRLLTVMANVAAARIEQARLAQIEQAERKLLDEIEQAAEIQQCVLPAGPPRIDGFDVAGFNLPCRTVGGDYYGFFPYRDGRFGMALGDVSGKGMPAALMMMALDARVQVLADQPEDLGEFVARLNRATCNRYPANRFITFVVCVLNPAVGEIRCANAGHGPAIVVRASGAVETLDEGGLVLGILPDESYREASAPFGDGDLVVLYSDGITEATNACDEEFGLERLTEVVVQNRHQPAHLIVDSVTRALAAFSGNAPAPDDVTLVVAKRCGQHG